MHSSTRNPQAPDGKAVQCLFARAAAKTYFPLVLTPFVFDHCKNRCKEAGPTVASARGRVKVKNIMTSISEISIYGAGCGVRVVKARSRTYIRVFVIFIQSEG